MHQAKALGYDLDRMGDTFYELFKEQSNVTSDAEFERLLQEDGLTVQEVKRKLIELRAPEEVIRFQVSSRIAVGDAEVAAYYAENPDQFRVAGKVTLREVVLLAGDAEKKKLRRAEIDEIRQRLVAGEDFGAVAREVSEAGTRDTGGVLGPLERSDLSTILEKSAFSLPTGQISEVMETPYGFHIIKVESRMEEHFTPLSEVQEKLRRFLEDQKFKRELASFLAKARSEAEWCVKPKYQELLSTPAPTSCGSL
jgi:peptidyl-prolyl cis-trans isomerase C